MKKLTFSLIVATVVATMSAKQISVSEAASVAQKYLPAIEASSAKPLKKSVNTTVSAPEYYIFNAPDGNGFVIVSGDDQLTEVIGYSDKGSFVVSDDMPVAIKNYLNDYSKYVQAVREGNAQPNYKNIQYASTPIVAPLVTTQWNQTEPYNNLCPYDSTADDRCPTGCAATALAQVMNYHEWPATGVGSNTYITNYGTHSVDFTKSNYDWANMRDTYTMYQTPDGTKYEYTETEANAVAKLMWDCGVAMDMYYNINASGSTDAKVQYAATNHFNYNTELIFRDACVLSTQFLNKIKAALDASKPVVFSGQGDLGGHAYVADGYDANNFLHINWGWGGLSDGYFSIDNMAPSSLGTGGGAGGFNYDQSALIITPCTSGTPTTTQIPLSIYEDEDGYFKANASSWNKGDSFITSLCQLWNCYDDTYTGSIAAGIFSFDGTLVAQSSSKNVNLKGGYVISSVYNFDLTSQVRNLADGEYRIKPICKATGESEWAGIATSFYVDIVVEGNKITNANREASLQLVGNITSDKESYSIGDDAILYVNLQNLSDITARGELKLLVRDADTNAKKKTISQDIIVSGLTTSGTSISTPISASQFAVGKRYKVEIVSYTPTDGGHELITPSSGYECIFNIVDPDDGAVETITTDEVRVYPNPATDYICVSADQVTRIDLYSTSGSLVKSVSGVSEIAVDDCPAGMYILSITTPNYTKKQTVIVK